MTYPPEPQTAIGKVLHDRFDRLAAARRPVARCDREAVKLLLIGNPAAVEQCVIELERKGFCDSYAWSPALPLPENASVIQSHPGEVMRVYKRWYPPTAQRIPL